MLRNVVATNFTCLGKLHVLRKLPVEINITSLVFEGVSKLYMVVNILYFSITERAWRDTEHSRKVQYHVMITYICYTSSPGQERTTGNFTCKTPTE